VKTFIPVTDDLLFEPDAPIDRLVPYQVGQPCFRWQAVIDFEGASRAFRGSGEAFTGQASGDHPLPPPGVSPSRR
jgi:hypothetical protein